MQGKQRIASLGPDWEKKNRLLMVPNRPGRRRTFRYFYVHFYPKHVTRLLYAAEDRWALVLACASSIQAQVENDVHTFTKQAKLHIAAGPQIIPLEWDILAICQSATWPSLFQGLLVFLKSLLDLMGTTWAMIAYPATSMRGFRKGRVDQEELAGGKLINWFRQSCPTSFHKSADVADAVQKHSRAWITQAVNYRDTLVHYGNIAGLKPLALRVKLKRIKSMPTRGRPVPNYTPEEVLRPAMPDG
jgi:hypothetical protein